MLIVEKIKYKILKKLFPNTIIFLNLNGIKLKFDDNDKKLIRKLYRFYRK